MIKLGEWTLKLGGQVIAWKALFIVALSDYSRKLRNPDW